MLRNKRKILIVVMFLLFSITVRASYIETNKDTKMPPDTVTYVIEEPTDMQYLATVGDLKFYYRDSRDVFAIHDTRNGYTWKTGLDIAGEDELKEACEILLASETPPTDEEIDAVCLPYEDFMNTRFEAFSNSLVTLEFYNDSNGVNRTPSTHPTETGPSTLMMVNGDPTHYRLEIPFYVIDLTVFVHIYLTEDGLSLEIKDDELQGEDQNLISSFIFTPLMGASGGATISFDKTEMDYGRAADAVDKPQIPGYIMVPDGSGALIRFEDYDTSISSYYGNVYGSDYSTDTYYDRVETNFVPIKQPGLPIYGIAHGNRQAAFFAHATEGEEFMELVVSPQNGVAPNRSAYTFAFARFNYNTLIYQVYNNAGSGYTTMMEERPHYDIRQNYVFLAGDGSLDGYPADYVGMAKKYKDILIEDGVLTPREDELINMPIRLDFIMADAMDSLIGTTDVVVTTIDQVKDILTTLTDQGVFSINSGLYGYQKGGITLGDKDAPRFSRAIGTKREFDRVITDLNEQGIDVSLALDYATIYEQQMSLIGNATKHANGWYIREYLRNEVGPVNERYFARPSVIASWIISHEKATRSLGATSYTYEGFTELLYSDYNKKGATITEAIDMYQTSLQKIKTNYKVNGVRPNQYLWPYIDRYLQAPMFTSQYLIETDTVPFLQLVLQGAMEVYATYANFSFYTDADVLRMIDYNVYPSFMLTHDPAYELISTNSSNFYSTEFSLYQDRIVSIYDEMNRAYINVLNANWIDRQVYLPGVIVNTYSNGVKIVINYTDSLISYQGNSVTAQSFRVLD
ncbi:MAG TPA: DUF5696 domain-containing protein [Acholeplasmataceae bacterium]|nr:DUF5696 domain-containing protein [Acholeplasmataceae bacterium]